MTRISLKRFFYLGLCGVAAAGIGMADLGGAFAQNHDRGGGGGQEDDGGHEDGGDKGNGGARRGGTGGAERGGSGRGSLRDVFNQMESEADAERASGKAGAGAAAGAGAGAGGAEQGKKQAGKKATGGTSAAAGRSATGGRPEGKGPGGSEGGEEDSDRPDWAGVSGPESKPGRGGSMEPGVKKGDIYGDLYVIVRDENGVPVLDANGYVQVEYVNADGTLTCCVLRDAEGNLLPTLADGTPVSPIEVELGRLSVGRSPDAVLAAQYEEAVTSINAAVSVALDASGRLVLTNSDGTTQTIDSPLENLALYVELLSTGTLADISADKLGSLSYLVDGTLTAQDLAVAASFFAAASDKVIPITTDAVVYMNTILDVTGTLDGYVDYSAFTYDRETVYGDMQIEVLVLQDGVWVPTVVNVYDAVFGSTDTGDLTNIAAFTAATDDARAVINFIHEYALPATD